MIKVSNNAFTKLCYRFYPVILAISCIFLLATVYIYTRYEELLNHYTRIMRHFAISMCCAFFVLIVNQSTDFVKDSPGFCKLLGGHTNSIQHFLIFRICNCLLYFLFFFFFEAILQLYLFLTAFNLMTIMSVETYLHLR